MTPVAGWYPDPEGRVPYRWWDGQRWAPALPAGAAMQGWAPRPVSPEQLAQRRMRKEDSARPWARVGIWVVAFGPLASALVVAWIFKPFWTQLRTFFHAAAHTSSGGLLPALPHLSPWASAAADLMALVNQGGLIALIVWMYRAATHAQGLGYPSARTPVWAIWGFIVPVVNLWFPYQVCVGCLPTDAAPARRIALRWWLLHALAGIVFSAMGFISAFVPGVWIVLLVGGGAWAFAEALFGQAMVAAVSAAHRQATADVTSSWA